MRKSIFLCIVAMSFLQACAGREVRDPSILRSGIEAHFTVEGATVEEQRVIYNALRRYHEKAYANMFARFVIRDDEEYFRYRKDDGSIGKAAAHCHPSGQKICISRRWFHEDIIHHEFGHAMLFHDWLMTERWQREAGDVYHNGEKSLQGKYPRDGVLTWYGGSDYHDDFAEWNEELRTFLAGHYSWPLAKMDVGDGRYLRKLQVFYDYEKITKEEYERILKTFFTK